MSRSVNSLQILLCAAAVMSSACASYSTEMRSMRGAYESGGYAAALTDLESSSLKDSSKDRLLYHLERSMIVDRMGDRKDSRKLLLDADQIVDELFTTRISKVATSFVMNDASAEYEGEDYEQVAIHTELALSYLDDGNLSDAAVEARRINSKLSEINDKHGDKKNRYADDGFARYLSAAIHEQSGNADSAIIDYRSALNVFKGGSNSVYASSPPASLIRPLWRLLDARKRTDEAKSLAERYPKEVEVERRDMRGSGEVIVFHEAGEIAAKEQQDFFLPIAEQVIRFSWPVIPYSSSLHGFTGIEIQAAKVRSRADVINDENTIARATLDDKRVRMIVKAGARLIAKGQLTRYANDHFGPLAGIAANVFSAATETADTRSWMTLPEAFAVSRMRLMPGKHTVAIYNNGKIARMAELNIAAGQIVLIRDNGTGK